MIPIEISPQKSSVPRCPSCGNNGKIVKTTTLYSLIKKERQDSITESRYFFCGSKGCDVVYFTGDDSQTFYKQDLVVRVGVKEDSPPRPICYCFNHSVEEIFDEIKQTGKSTVMDDIRSRMKKGGCSCETKNPQGSCCLGTVEYFVKEAFSKPRFAYLGPIGGIISAILASICCVGPFVLVMLGAGGAWVGNLRVFEPYRPIFILLTLGFLGAGFYNVYKKPKEDCKPGSLCAVPQTKRGGKIMIWTVTIIVFFLLIIPYLIGLLV